MAELTEDQKTIESLKKELQTVQIASDKKDELVETLRTQLSKKDADLVAAKASVQALTTDSARKDAELKTASEVVADLKVKLADKDAGTVTLPSVKVGKDTYELTSPFMYAGKEVTIELLKEDSTLAAELVKEGVGNLRKLAAKA